MGTGVATKVLVAHQPFALHFSIRSGTGPYGGDGGCKLLAICADGMHTAVCACSSCHPGNCARMLLEPRSEDVLAELLSPERLVS